MKPKSRKYTAVEIMKNEFKKIIFMKMLQISWIRWVY